ncbi:hypothetical protein L7F22_063536 [Adiantum nelumboides]|nr:hypothetical protein [Adiantum nelumboides]
MQVPAKLQSCRGVMAQLNQTMSACSSSLFFYSSRTQLLPPPSLSLSRATCKPSLIGCNSSAPSDELKKPTIGFLGLGIMGTAMATNLIKAGYNVSVWNRNATKCEPLTNQGARCGSSPAEIASQCNITFAMLADPAAALEVASGEHGVIHGLGPGKGYVDVSTVDGGTSKTINGLVKATGASFLEAPVSGSKKPAENGTLIFLTAGDKELYDQSGPMLDVMGKSRFYLGEVGNGAAMKLIVNMVMGSMMASFSEGLVLGDKIGLNPSTIIEAPSTLKGPFQSLELDGAFLETLQALQQLTASQNFRPLEDLLHNELSTKKLLKSSYQQVSSCDLLLMDSRLRGDMLALIQTLYRGHSISGGHLLVQPTTNYVISYPVAPLTDYKSPSLRVSILDQEFKGVIVDGGSGINLILEFVAGYQVIGQGHAIGAVASSPGSHSGWPGCISLRPLVHVVISQGAISSPMFTMKGPSMVNNKFTPAFPLKHQQKDLRLALQLAESVSQAIPVAASANEIYKVAKSKGFGDQDFSAVIEALKSD